MHIPSQKQWQKVIDTLKSVLHLAKSPNNFNMDIGILPNEPCGTICCVAGWYAVAQSIQGWLELLNNDDWILGKDLLAKDLGFKNGQEVKTWADENRTLWGNSNGYSMFMDAYAYNSGIPGVRANTLYDVINHYEFVKQQCYAYTNKKTVANDN